MKITTKIVLKQLYREFRDKNIVEKQKKKVPENEHE